VKAQFTVVGVLDADGWPPPAFTTDLSVIPREGEQVSFPFGLQAVRSVMWFPLGDEDGDEPFVHIVVGPSRPRR